MSLRSLIHKLKRKKDIMSAKANDCGRYIVYDNGLELRSNKILLYVIHLTSQDIPGCIFDNITLYDELGFDIVIVITFSEMNFGDAVDLSGNYFKNQRVIIRQNYGKDFGGFSDAMSILPHDFKGKLVFQNDSIIGPLYKSDFVREFAEMNVDFAGVTESFYPKYHLQSSFLSFSGIAIDNLRDFFKFEYKVYNFRPNIIHLGEIGLTQFMLRRGIPAVAFFKQLELINFSSAKGSLRSAVPLKTINPQHFFAEFLFTQLDYPYIKRELLTQNPTRQSFSWANILKKMDADHLEKLRQSVSSRL